MTTREVSTEEFARFEKFQAQEVEKREKSKVYREKRSKAIATLISSHQKEYDDLMA